MGEHTTELNVSNFDSKIAKGNWIVDCYALWCGPCKILAPILDEIAKEQKGKVHVGKLNVDENNEIAQRFEVMSIPTVIFFKDGEMINSVIGVRDKEEYLGLIKDSF